VQKQSKCGLKVYKIHPKTYPSPSRDPPNPLSRADPFNGFSKMLLDFIGFYKIYKHRDGSCFSGQLV
jgi:hypothetical protein